MKPLRVLALTLTLAALGCGNPEAYVELDDSSREESASALGSPVSLRTAQAWWTIPPQTFVYSAGLKGTVNVANLAYEKRVTVHYQVRTRSETVQAWTTVEARWARGDTWEFESPSYPGNCPHYCKELLFDFAIEYRVGGGTYWDNNGGWNHTVSTDVPPVPGGVDAPIGILRGPKVELSRSSLDTYGDWQSELVLQNVAYDKAVTLVYSTDGWQTVQHASAAFNRLNQNGLELWRAKVQLGQAGEVKFAVRYEVGGQVYWDNNLGRDYAVVRR